MDRETQEYIANLIRQGTTQWKGRELCLRRARKKVLVGTHKNGNPQYKLHWQCAECRTWYPDKTMLEVDHIKEIGPYSGNLHEYAARVYCGQENLQALCVVCHKKKTSGYNATRRFERKKLISGCGPESTEGCP